MRGAVAQRLGTLLAEAGWGAAMRDLHDAGCDILTITQYLRPSKLHHPVDRWVKPQEFVELSRLAEEIGFAAVMSGPMVRSSYRAGKLYVEAMAHRGLALPENLKHLAQTSQGATDQEAETLLNKYGASEETPVVSAGRPSVTLGIPGIGAN